MTGSADARSINANNAEAGRHHPSPLLGWLLQDVSDVQVDLRYAILLQFALVRNKRLLQPPSALRLTGSLRAQPQQRETNR